MLVAGYITTSGHRRWRPGPAPRMWRALGTTIVAMLAAVSLTGCFTQASAAPSMQVSTAYVPVPHNGTTVAYLVIRNNGSGDTLESAHTSAGGRVTFHYAPDAPGAAALGTGTVPSVPVPGHSTLKMSPNGFYLVITGAGPMHGGKAITLTLVFARAGPVSVVAQITNPENGGSSYFMN